jgi:hypothetical protein
LSAPQLKDSAISALQAAVILLRDTRGFMFLPLFAESERAASTGLEFLKSQLASDFYTVAWPISRQLPISDQRVQLLANLDDAIGKLPADTVVVVDATSSIRQVLALEVMAYINQRREPLKAGGLRLLLCWPIALKDELMSNAPDLWSVRAASPWLEELEPTSLQFLPALGRKNEPTAKVRPASMAMAEKLARWQKFKNLKDADFSTKDAFGLAAYQYANLQFESAAELANAVYLAIDAESERADDEIVKVDALNMYSSALQRLGNIIAALEASKIAVSMARQLAKINPIAYEPVLAGNINNLASLLSRSGDRIGALKAAQESVEVTRRLVTTSPKAYESDLAGFIHNLAYRLSDTGDRAGALAAAQEAVAINRRLVNSNPALEPVLAASINNLAGTLSQIGDRPGALKAALEAVAIDKRLAKANPAIYDQDLAASISNLASFLSDNGDNTAALIAAKEAVAIYKGLAKINPAAYEPDLAVSINNLASFLGKAGDHQIALKAAQESVAIRSRLAKTNPAAYEPDLAGSLNNLAQILRENGDHAGALTASQQAVALYEKANQATPGAFAEQLATAKWVRDKLI